MGVASRHKEYRVTVRLTYVLWLIFRVMGRRYSFRLHLLNAVFRTLTHTVVINGRIAYCVFVVVFHCLNTPCNVLPTTGNAYIVSSGKGSPVLKASAISSITAPGREAPTGGNKLVAAAVNGSFINLS